MKSTISRILLNYFFYYYFQESFVFATDDENYFQQ